MTSKFVNPEWLKANVPCMKACPVQTNAGGYVALIAQGRYEEAYRLAAEPNPLASICGHICAAPCEVVCRRGDIDQPIAIRALKRFVAERYGVYSKRGRQRIVSQLRTSRRDETKERIAVIGAGPSGLTAAFELARLGYLVTIFEASPVAGGMLSLGIPEYRLPRYIIQAQVDEILSLGVELRTNSRLGRDFSIDDLRAKGFKAFFIAIGAHKGRGLRIEGIDLDGVLNGVDFLLNANLNYRVELGQRVIVVGGGNVAVDVARSVVRFENAVPDYGGPEQFLREALDTARQALRLGARDVALVCLESREEMPAFQEEIEGAQEEGIIIYNRLGPKRILGKGGRVAGLETIEVAGVFDERGRFNPTFKPNTEAQIPADTIVLAIGQQVDLSFISNEDGLEVGPNGLLVVDQQTLATPLAGVFAGGDVAFGPRNVIAAVADGQKAALSIHSYLRKAGPEQPEQIQIDISPVGGFKQPWDDYDATPRQPIPALPVERRIGVAEVELGYTEALAVREAKRCLHCWVNTIFEGREEEGSECILCGGCVDICPEDCIELVSLARFSCDEEVEQFLEEQVRGPLEMGERPVQFAVMIKDEKRCIRCGLCAVRCPVDCITMEAFSSSQPA